MKLLVVEEVHHLEIVIGRAPGDFPAASPARRDGTACGALRNTPMPQKYLLLGHKLGDEKENVVRLLYISDFRDHLPALFGQNLSLRSSSHERTW